jgi:hypothetical protein
VDSGYPQWIEREYLKNARAEIKSLKINKNYSKLLCSLLYWCEGTKNSKNGVCFINSDPNLIKKFLTLLRASFELNEIKFRPCIHLHAYHSPEIQLDFWPRITNINKQQFIRPYIKPNSGKRIRQNYPGCISIRYHSNDLARRLLAIAKAYFE